MSGSPAPVLVGARPGRGAAPVLAPAGRHRAGPAAQGQVLPGALAVGAALSLVLLVVGAATHSGPVRAAGALWFLVLGVGSAPWQSTRRLRSLDRLALSALTGAAVVVLVPTLALGLGRWRPAALVAALVVPVLVLHLRCWRDGAGAALLHRLGEARARSARSWWTAARRCALPPCLALVGLGLVVAASLQHRHTVPGYYGFLRVVGPSWYLGLACVVVALVLLRPAADAGAWCCATVLVLVVTLTPALVYDTPRVASTVKHVDLVRQVLTTGHLESTTAVYDAWPGFFAAAAWVCDVAGVRDPSSLAHCWAALLSPLRVLALAHLVSRVVPSRRWAWTAAAAAVLADTVGQDYFSPQSLGFVLGLLVLGVALDPDRGGRARSAALLLAGSALAVEHQLSPYVVGGTLVLFALLRQVPAAAAASVLVPALTWTALHRDALAGYLSFSALGSLANFRPPHTVGTHGLARLPAVQHSVQALLLGVLVLGALALVGLVRGRQEARTRALAAAPVVGLVFIGANSYGSEGIFRATLFGLPWLAALAARGLAAAPRPRLLLAPSLVVLCATCLVATYALDPFFVVRAGDVSAVSAFTRAGAGVRPTARYLVSLGGGDLPSQPSTPVGRAEVVDGALLHLPVRQERLDHPDADVDRITTDLLRYTGRPAGSVGLYVLWSPTSQAYDEAYAVQSAEQFRALLDAFRRSPAWTVVLSDRGTVLLTFDPSGYGGPA